MDIEPLIIEYNNLKHNFNHINNVISLNKTPEEMKNEFNNYNILCQFLLKQVEEKINQLSPETKVRRRRGLINGLGSVIKFITGNLDNDDLQQIEARLKSLENNNNDQTEILKTQSNLAEEAINQINNTIRNLTLNQQVLKIKIVQLERAIQVEKTKRYHSLYATSVYTQITIMAQNILQILETIEDSITFAKLQVLHPSIIQPEDLLQNLKKIEKSTSLPFPVQISEIIHFENIIKIKAYQIDHKFTFLLEVPIIDKIDYKLYHTYSCPVLKTNNIFQTIIPNNKFLVLTNQYYSSFENICKLIDKVYYCYNLDLTNLNDKPLCEIQLLLAQKPNDKCNSYSLKMQKEKIQFIENNFILLVSPFETSITYQCKKNSQNELLPSGTYLLRNFENCKLEINNKIIQFPILEIKNELYIPHLNFNFTVKTNYSIEEIDLSPINLDGLKEIKYKLEKQQNVLKYNKMEHIYIPSIWTIIIYAILICFSIYIIYKIKLRLQERRKSGQPGDDPIELQP